MILYGILVKNFGNLYVEMESQPERALIHSNIIHVSDNISYIVEMESQPERALIHTIIANIILFKFVEMEHQPERALIP